MEKALQSFALSLSTRRVAARVLEKLAKMPTEPGTHKLGPLSDFDFDADLVVEIPEDFDDTAKSYATVIVPEDAYAQAKGFNGDLLRAVKRKLGISGTWANDWHKVRNTYERDVTIRGST